MTWSDRRRSQRVLRAENASTLVAGLAMAVTCGAPLAFPHLGDTWLAMLSTQRSNAIACALTTVLPMTLAAVALVAGFFRAKPLEVGGVAMICAAPLLVHYTHGAAQIGAVIYGLVAMAGTAGGLVLRDALTRRRSN